MGKFKSLTLLLAAVGFTPAGAQCRLCDVPDTGVSQPSAGNGIVLEIETSLNFDRLIVGGTGDGTATLRPDGSTAPQGAVEEMSARAMVGSAVVRGEPGRAVRVDLPPRIVLTSTGGGQIVLEDVQSDLPAIPRLDSAGRLSFRFGGRLRLSGDADGEFRGDLPITVEYL